MHSPKLNVKGLQIANRRVKGDGPRGRAFGKPVQDLLSTPSAPHPHKHAGGLGLRPIRI